MPDPSDTAAPPTPSAAASGVLRLAADLEVRRLGYGAMQLTGPGVWGEPADRAGAVHVLRHCIELGVQFIDTADSYGPYVAEELIREALHPYPDDLVIATKAGLIRTGPGEWHPLGRPEYLRQEVEMSLRRLRLDRIDLFQLHRIDPQVAAEDQIGELVKLQDEGKIGHIGLSEVSVAELEHARSIATIVTVQNRFNLTDRTSEDVLDAAESAGIGFIPWFPIATGALAKPGGPLDALSAEIGATPAQLALAWLLERSPVMLPIPGTSSVQHLNENVAAARVHLTPEHFEALDRIA